MTEAEIKFEREGREGIVPIGTYIIDAFKRMGIAPDDVCQPELGMHFCEFEAKVGASLLSPKTKAENEYFKTNAAAANARLACQTKIESPGEVVIMTTKKETKATADAAEAKDTSEDYQKAFAELPLEKKIASLVQLEAIALGETVSFVINSPFKIFDMAMGVMAEFGLKLEAEEKEAARPEEHRDVKENTAAAEDESAKDEPIPAQERASNEKDDKEKD